VEATDAAAQKKKREVPAATVEYRHVVALHAAHYADLLSRMGPVLQGGGPPSRGQLQLEALQRLGAERSNVIEALDTACNTMTGGQCRAFARYLWLYFDMVSEWATLVPPYGRLLKAADLMSDRELVALSAVGLARGKYRLGDYDAALRLAQQSLEVATAIRDNGCRIQALLLLVRLYRTIGDYALCRDALQLLEELTGPEDPADFIQALITRGVVEFDWGHHEAAATSTERALALLELSGNDLNALAMTNGNLGLCRGAQGRLAEERTMHERCLELSRVTGNLWVQATALNNLGLVETSEQRLDDARQTLADALDLTRQLGDPGMAAYCWNNLGSIEFLSGNLSAATQYILEGLRLRLDVGDWPRLTASIFWSGAVLAALGELEHGIIALHGARLHAEGLGYSFDAIALQGEADGARRIGEAVAAGELTKSRKRAQEMQAEALSLEELARLCIKALRHHCPLEPCSP
jgi:tetratricopeptide (TPR) repeat protein